MDLRLLFNKEKYGEKEVEMAADLVHKMLRWFPGDRISAAEAMSHPFLSDVEIN
jgi:serine/threonine protein kinase